ncbi:MAG TPA: pyridoxamine 5'-phosphate oxidase family protein [Polyangia bacterium]|jgi:general stress protein 26
MFHDGDEKRNHLHELLEDFDTAMLVTRAPDGSLRGRPLTVAAAQDDGCLYFSTSTESPKVAELEADAHVAVTFQDDKRYVSLSGTARLTRDRALIERLWSESWKVWFPKGKIDPTLAILVVTPVAGEYWDQTGLAGLRYLASSVKAYATGNKPPDGTDERQNAKVPL